MPHVIPCRVFYGDLIVIDIRPGTSRTVCSRPFGQRTHTAVDPLGKAMTVVAPSIDQ